MDFKQIFLNNENILISGIYFTAVEWKKLSVSESSKNFDGMHGRKVSPTFARQRTITIEGIVDRMDEEISEMEKISHLERIFALQGNVSILEEKELKIIDGFSREWKIFVKIKTPLEFLEGDTQITGSHWKWRVVLESTSLPYYQSVDELFSTGQEGKYGGLKIGSKIPLKMNGITAGISVNASNIASPVRFEITAIAPIVTPIKITNTTDKTIFSANISANAGDIIIIDSEKFLITKNGVNISDSRIFGSVWQNAKGNTKFVIEDGNGNHINSMQVKIFYSQILL